MSKVDAQRALRDARFAAYREKVAAQQAAAGKPVAARGAAPVAAAAAAAAASPAASAGEVAEADPAATATEAPKRPRTAKTARSGPRETPTAGTDGADATDGTATALCGHRNMGGKSCTRPAGHSEKNHRYG